MGKRTLDHVKIIELYKSGKSTVEIADQLDCSVAGACRALKMNGVKRRKNAKRSDTEKHLGFKPTEKWMKRLLKKHESAASAARSVGIPYPTFVDWMRRFNINRNRTGIPTGSPNSNRQEIPVKEAIRLSDGGMSYSDLADRYSVSYGVTSRRMREAGYTAPKRRDGSKFRTFQTDKRRVLRELQIEKCEICGEDRAFDFCHIVPGRDGGPVSKENALILCPNHHRFLDRGLLGNAEFKKISRKVDKAHKLFQ